MAHTGNRCRISGPVLVLKQCSPARQTGVTCTFKDPATVCSMLLTCNVLLPLTVTQDEIEALYSRFRALDRSSKVCKTIPVSNAPIEYRILRQHTLHGLHREAMLP